MSKQKPFRVWATAGDLTENEFWTLFDRESSPTGCWLWKGTPRPSGHSDIKYQGKIWGVHRLAYTFHYGAIPDGLMICHQCNVPACGNPYHLYAGTHADNVRDMIDAGRNFFANKTHCKRGHSLDDAKVNAKGSRVCRQCIPLHKHAYRQRLREAGLRVK